MALWYEEMMGGLASAGGGERKRRWTLTVVQELLMQPKTRWELMLKREEENMIAYMFYSYYSLYNLIYYSEIHSL